MAHTGRLSLGSGSLPWRVPILAACCFQLFLRSSRRSWRQRGWTRAEVAEVRHYDTTMQALAEPPRAAPRCRHLLLGVDGVVPAGHRQPAPARRHLVCLAVAQPTSRGSRDGENRAVSGHRVQQQRQPLEAYRVSTRTAGTISLLRRHGDARNPRSFSGTAHNTTPTEPGDMRSWA